jgi:hypothetical protein
MGSNLGSAGPRHLIPASRLDCRVRAGAGFLSGQLIGGDSVGWWQPLLALLWAVRRGVDWRCRGSPRIAVHTILVPIRMALKHGEGIMRQPADAQHAHPSGFWWSR